MTDSPTLDQIRAKLKEVKHISDSVKWVEKPTNSAYLEGVVDLYDEDFNTIPGLTLICTFKMPVQTENVSYKFFVHWKMGKFNRRIFGLEIYDKDYISHRNKKKRETVRGPHYHLGCQQYLKSKAVVKEVKLLLNSIEFDKWYGRLAKHAKINTMVKPEKPFDIDLFGNAIVI